jgi:hypothetical protein
MANIKYGFADLRTGAELAIGAGKPAGRDYTPFPSPRSTGKYGKFLGKISSAARMSSAAYAGFKAALAAKAAVSALTTSLTNATKGFDAAKASMLAGVTSNIDTRVFPTSLAGGVSFYSANDLIQISSIAPGQITANISEIAAKLDQRKKRLIGITANISASQGNASLFGLKIRENYDRHPYPLPEDVNSPAIPRLAQGGAAAANDPIVKDKRRLVMKARIALSKPVFFKRFAIPLKNPMKLLKQLPGYNVTLNMKFNDDKANQSGWSEPASRCAPQYSYNKVIQTESGHVIEYDDTPGAERIHICHRSGSFIEFHPDGQVTYKSLHHGYAISMGDYNIGVKGTCNISVEGNTNIYSRGQLNLQSDSDINMTTKQNFNVHAENINLRATKKSLMDGTEIDLRYAKLPGVPVFTAQGPAVRIIPAALKLDFPTTYLAIKEQEDLVKDDIKKRKASILKRMGAAAAGVTTLGGSALLSVPGNPAAGTTKMAEDILAATKEQLALIGLMMDGPNPQIAKLAKQLAFKKFSDKEEPIDNPLGNPLIYNVRGGGAAEYRALMFDTPEETQDTEHYQAHIDTRKALNDLRDDEGPQLAGSRTTLTTGIVTPTELPLVNYLNPSDYTGKFDFTPATTLGNTTFTVRDLADSLARPDVANFEPPVVPDPVDPEE